MPKRLPYEIAILAALLLGSCGSMPTSFTQEDSRRLDYAEANIRNAVQASSAMVDRVERAERRLEELEQDMQDRERMEDAIIGDVRALRDRYNTHTH